jgi:FMN phosphatase YigB (HAD superfamily)
VSIQSFCNIAFSDMLFFDDNLENILVAQHSGVTSVHVSQKYGLNWRAFMDGLTGWRSRKSIQQIASIPAVLSISDDTKESKVNESIAGAA